MIAGGSASCSSRSRVAVAIRSYALCVMVLRFGPGSVERARVNRGWRNDFLLRMLCRWVREIRPRLCAAAFAWRRRDVGWPVVLLEPGTTVKPTLWTWGKGEEGGAGEVSV